MSIILDPSKNFVTVQIMYIEETDDKHGSTTFHFIKNREDFDEWKAKGYLTSDEFTQKNLAPANPEPGMPEQPTHDPNKIINILRTWWSRMSWKEQNQVYAQCLKVSTDDEGKSKTELDMISFRDFKLKTCFKKWDYKENGVDIPLTPQVVDNLYPEVAQELLNNFERITEATDEELGES